MEKAETICSTLQPFVHPSIIIMVRCFEATRLSPLSPFPPELLQSRGMSAYLSMPHLLGQGKRGGGTTLGTEASRGWLGERQDERGASHSR